MAYFARKLWYGACDGEDSHVFAAFLELRRRKNGKPVAFVFFEHRVFTSEYLGRVSGMCENRMLRFPQCTSAEETLKRFVPGQEEFPGWNCEQWEKTTFWAYEVGVGGSYQLHHPGRWVRIGVPPLWSKRRRRRKPLRFGLSAHIILVDEARIRGLEEDIDELAYQLNDLESYDDEDGSNYVPKENQAEYETIENEVALLKGRIASIRAKIEVLREKMRAEVRLKFPVPLNLIPKRVSRLKEAQRTR